MRRYTRSSGNQKRTSDSAVIHEHYGVLLPYLLWYVILRGIFINVKNM